MRLLMLPILLAGLVLVAACTGSPSRTEARVAPTPGAVPVKAVAVARGDITATLSYTGDVRARSQITVLPKVSGRLEKLHVDVGTVVQPGDAIAELDRVQAEAQVLQARAALAAAEAKLAGLRAGGRPEQVAQAQANLRAARAKLEALEKGPRPEQVAQAELNLEIARQKLAYLESLPRQEVVAQAEANVALAKAKLEQVLKGSRPEEVELARQDVEKAKNAVLSAQAARDGACSNYAKALDGGVQCNVYKGQLGQAEAGLRQAEERLKLALQGPTQETIDQAKAGLRAAEEQLEQARRPATEQELAQARAAVAIAEQQLALAREPYTEQDLEQARAAVAAAEQQVALARNPVSQEDIQAAEAAVEQARAALEAAMVPLQESTIVSPMEGVVVEKFQSEGSLVGPTTPIVALASPDLEVVVAVEEANLARVAPGMPVKIAVPAYPGESFSGKVRLVAPTVDPRSRTVSVKVEPEDRSGRLKPGMFATIAISAQHREGALLVPREALMGQPPSTAVFVVKDGRAVRQQVRLGIADETRVEVVQGLADGDLVVVSGQAGLNDGDAVVVEE